MNKLALLSLLLLLPLTASAQRRFTVCDVETLQPVDGAGTEVADSMGAFSVPDSCRSLLVSHVNYESRLLNVTEVHDTIFLVSKTMSMSEVVVFGRGKDDGLSERLKRQIGLSKTDAQLIAADPAGGANLLGLIGKLIPKKNSRKAKRQEKARQIIENY